MPLRPPKRKAPESSPEMRIVNARSLKRVKKEQQAKSSRKKSAKKSVKKRSAKKSVVKSARESAVGPQRATSSHRNSPVGPQRATSSRKKSVKKNTPRAQAPVRKQKKLKQPDVLLPLPAGLEKYSKSQIKYWRQINFPSLDRVLGELGIKIDLDDIIGAGSFGKVCATDSPTIVVKLNNDLVTTLEAEQALKKDNAFALHMGLIGVGPAVLGSGLAMVPAPQGRPQANMFPAGYMVMRRYETSLDDWKSLQPADTSWHQPLRALFARMANTGLLCVDLKDSNIVVNSSNSGTTVADIRLIDFGGDYCYRRGLTCQSKDVTSAHRKTILRALMFFVYSVNMKSQLFYEAARKALKDLPVPAKRCFADAVATREDIADVFTWYNKSHSMAQLSQDAKYVAGLVETLSR